MNNGKLVMVLGYGRMGRATVDFLHRMNYNVMVLDKIPLSIPNALSFEVSTIDSIHYFIDINFPHLVVSTLPYTENLAIATYCIEHGVNYCDLGGKVSNTIEIRKLTGDKNVAVATDLGLAPGLINILTEYALKNVSPKDSGQILAAVGGIPVSGIDPPFSYHCTWSVEGLVNEYLDLCLHLNSGELMNISPLRKIEHLYINKLDKKLEAFTTSGAAAHSVHRLKELGYTDFIYKTLRYPGHRNFIRTIVDDYGADNLASIITRLSDTAPVKDDMVVGLVQFNNYKKEFVINNSNQYTAMQIATAAPLAVVASMILDGHLPRRYLDYGDIVKHFAYFKHKLQELGVII